MLTKCIGYLCVKSPGCIRIQKFGLNSLLDTIYQDFLIQKAHLQDITAFLMLLADVVIEVHVRYTHFLKSYIKRNKKRTLVGYLFLGRMNIYINMFSWQAYRHVHKWL